MTPQESKNKPASETPNTFADASSEGADVQGIHKRIVSREKEEPEEGFEPTPWWVWAVSVVVLFSMGFYLGHYGGSFSVVAHEVEEPLAASTTPVKKEVKGDVVFVGVCQACHQASGLGLPGQYPPLMGSEWLVKDAQTPIRIVLRGLQGEITVKGATFNNKMPQFFDKLSNEEIAAVLTYVRSSWGNSAPAVTAAEVDSVREKTEGRPQWTAPELDALRKSQ